MSAAVSVGVDVKDAMEDAGGKPVEVLPSGEYVKKVYKVKTPSTGRKSGMVSLSYSKESDYVMLEQVNWSADFNSHRYGGGYKDPGYVNIYTHR